MHLNLFRVCACNEHGSYESAQMSNGSLFYFITVAVTMIAAPERSQLGPGWHALMCECLGNVWTLHFCSFLTSCVTEMFHALPTRHSACRQPINGNAIYHFIVFLHGSIFVAEAFLYNSFVYSGFYVCHNCSPYKVLYSIFTNVSVMSAKDTLEAHC